MIILYIIAGLSFIATGIFWRPVVTHCETLAEREHAEWAQKAAADRAADTDEWIHTFNTTRAIYADLAPEALAAEHERVAEVFPAWFAELVGARNTDEWLAVVRVKYGIEAAA